MAVMMSVSGVTMVAVNVSVAVAVAAIVNVKLVALLTEVATVSPAGIPVPEIGVPARNDSIDAIIYVHLHPEARTCSAVPAIDPSPRMNGEDRDGTLEPPDRSPRRARSPGAVHAHDRTRLCPQQPRPAARDARQVFRRAPLAPRAYHRPSPHHPL